MSYSPLDVVVTGTVIASAWGMQVRANDAEQMAAKVTTAGDLAYATGAGALARLAAGATSTVLKGGTTPAFGTIDKNFLTIGSVCQVDSATDSGADVSLTNSYADIQTYAYTSPKSTGWLFVLGQLACATNTNSESPQARINMDGFTGVETTFQVNGLKGTTVLLPIWVGTCNGATSHTIKTQARENQSSPTSKVVGRGTYGAIYVIWLP